MMEAEEKDDADRYRAPALDKGLDILELLAEQKDGLTRAEITKLLGRNASEMYRMLERLVARQYVVRSAGGDRYSLSLKLYALAHRHPPMNRLIYEALPLMQRFSDRAEQSCHLVVYDRGNLLVIAQVDGPGTWGMSVRLGSRVGLIDTGSGRVMLAFQTPEQRAHMLAEHTKVKGEVTIDRDALEQTCEQIRTAGFSQKDSQQIFGVTDLTFPLLGPSGQAIADVSVSAAHRRIRRADPRRSDRAAARDGRGVVDVSRGDRLAVSALAWFRMATLLKMSRRGYRPARAIDTSWRNF
jgi:DNA-binding IclR family transcriptional regulator